MDDNLNTMYLAAIKGFQEENEILFNNYIAYRNIVKKILELNPRSFLEGDKDAYLSLSSINAIVKYEMKKLNEANEKFKIAKK